MTAAEPGGLLRTMDFPGHREKAVAEEWAETLAKQSGRRVCVVCGIHYDDLDRPGLDEVLYTLKKMLSVGTGVSEIADFLASSGR